MPLSAYFDIATFDNSYFDTIYESNETNYNISISTSDGNVTLATSEGNITLQGGKETSITI